MIRRHAVIAVLTSLLLLSHLFGALAQNPAQAQTAKSLPFVSPIFGDNMVLQRGKLNTIWGWSEPGDKVEVQFADKSASGVAGADGKWQVKIHPPAAGGPYTVKISGRQTLELKNVLVGDVWLCGGQSNMGVGLRASRNGEAEVKAANYPQIRYFSVAQHTSYHTTLVPEGSWEVVSPETAENVSAVAYYFARKVQEATHVPIGLVSDNVGGTPAESWTSAEGLRPIKDFDVPLAELEKIAASGGPEYGNYVMHWYDQYDIGAKGNWAAPELDDSTWKTVEIPGGFSEFSVPESPALVWFRKEIALPDIVPTGRNMMFLGQIERMDTVYVNGNQVGGSSWVENPRMYFIRGLKPGKNIIAVRVLKTKPRGGFLSKPEDLRIVLGNETVIPLAGKWKAQLSLDARPPHPLPLAYENWPVMPTVLYKGMLEPIAPLAITGALWYQGEQNSERGYAYRKVLPAMIADWRKLFDQGDFPFYVVSLPAFKQRSATPVDGDQWAETRESQAVTAATVPNTCLAVTIDTGDPDNIHPPDKQPVGERLALCALAKQYQKKVAYQAPTLAKVERRSTEIKLHFSHADGGLVVKGAKLGEFQIAGEDRKWYWANARIKGNTVVVSSPSVPNPKEVRYAWQSNPEATLFSAAGLPAAPFRTDKWPALTESVRPY